MEPIVVYTDGACKGNGYSNAKAGMGVYFGRNDPRNVSQEIEGRQTNNVAELMAIMKAAEVLKSEIDGGAPVIIYSDSVYAIRCCTIYGRKLHDNGWKSRGSGSIPNLELVKKAYDTFKDLTNVEIRYVRAHTNLTDVHSIGNEWADRLANQAIGGDADSARDDLPHARRRPIYLKVGFDEKDEAKKYGCRWDPVKKKWYIHSDSDPETLKDVVNRWGAPQVPGPSCLPTV